MIWQVSVGTLLAFTMVAISVLILRYVPPDEVPLPLQYQGSIDTLNQQYTTTEKVCEEAEEATQPLLSAKSKEGLLDHPLIVEILDGNRKSFICFFEYQLWT